MMLQMRGVSLRKIELADIELLRQWRNDDKIVKHMFYKQVITPPMQLAWFNSLSDKDFYFIIHYKEKKLGLINVCLNKETQEEAFVGLFIYEDKYWGTQIPVLASMALLKFAFEELQLQKVKAKVRPENIVAQKYNQQLGFSVIKDEIQTLDRKSYTKKLAVMISRMEGV